MIRVRTAPTPEKLEALLNEQQADGFNLRTLEFRGYEAVAVFEKMPTEKIVGIKELKIDGVDVPLSNVLVGTRDLVPPTGPITLHADHPSNWQPPKATETPKPAPVQQNSFKRRGR